MLDYLIWKKSFIEYNDPEYHMSDFITENEMQKYIEANKFRFMSEVLEINTRRCFEKEFKVGSKRVDFYCEDDKNNKYLIEIKCGDNSKNIMGLAQLMEYYILLNREVLSNIYMFLIITHYDKILLEIITKFRLPIEIIILSKHRAIGIKKPDFYVMFKRTGCFTYDEYFKCS